MNTYTVGVTKWLFLQTLCTGLVIYTICDDLVGERTVVNPVVHQEGKIHSEGYKECAGVGGDVAVLDWYLGELAHFAVVGGVESFGFDVNVFSRGHIVGHNIDVVDCHAVVVCGGAVDGVGADGRVGALHCADVELATTGVDGELEACNVSGDGVGHAHFEHTYYTLHYDVQGEAVAGAEGGVGYEGLLDYVAGEADDAAVEGAGVGRVVGYGNEVVGLVGLERHRCIAEVGCCRALLVDAKSVCCALLDDVDVKPRADGRDAAGGLHRCHLIGGEMD